jgi:hypothetical protein
MDVVVPQVHVPYVQVVSYPVTQVVIAHYYDVARGAILLAREDTGPAFKLPLIAE